MDCWREALSIANSWIRNPEKGKLPTVKTLRMWLTPLLSYRIKDGYIEIIGGYKLKIIGWDKRYDECPNAEARLVYKKEEKNMFLMISKKIPKIEKYTPKNILAVDVNERSVMAGNETLEVRYNTSVENALHFKKLAEELQEKYSSGKYRAWKSKNILKRIRYFHRKARNIVENWAKQLSHNIVELAKQHNYAIGREDLTNLIDSLRKLPKEHRIKTILLSYRKLIEWIDWQAEKNGVPIIIVEPNGTSSICPICNSKLVENGYRRLKCKKCGFEEDRDKIAILNIKKKAYQRIGGSLTTPPALQMKDVNPNRCREPTKHSKGYLPLESEGSQL